MRKRLQTVLDEAWLDPATWKGVWYMVNYTLQYNADLVKRRFSGEYDTDEWGLDWEFLDVVRPFFAFLYKIYWRVETTGIEHVPVEGRTVLVANHSGQLVGCDARDIFCCRRIAPSRSNLPAWYRDGI